LPVVGWSTVRTEIRIQVELFSTSPGAFPSQIATVTTTPDLIA
jgi:hypothetical protein